MEKQYDLAITQYEMALELCPDTDDCKEHKVGSVVQLGDDDGKKSCSSALSNISQAAFLHNRGACYYYQEDYAGTVEDMTAALELKPDYVKALRRRAQAFEQLDKLEEALKGVLVNSVVRVSLSPQCADNELLAQFWSRCQSTVGVGAAGPVRVAAKAPAGGAVPRASRENERGSDGKTEGTGQQSAWSVRAQYGQFPDAAGSQHRQLQHFVSEVNKQDNQASAQHSFGHTTAKSRLHIRSSQRLQHLQ